MYKRLALIILVASALSACAGARTVPTPVGVGTGTHELKKSPCACTEVIMRVPFAIDELG